MVLYSIISGCILHTKISRMVIFGLVFVPYFLNLSVGNGSSVHAKKLNIDGEQIALAADLSLFFDVALEAFGKPCLKCNTFSKLLETKSFYDLCDTWRIRNPTKSSYNFRQRCFSCFISNSLQESIKNTGFVTALVTGHSPVFLSVFNGNCEIYGHGFGKCNSSLTYDTEDVLQIKDLKQSFKSTHKTGNSQ